MSGNHAKYHPQFGSRPSPDEPSLRTFGNGVLNGVQFSAMVFVRRIATNLSFVATMSLMAANHPDFTTTEA